MLFMATNSFPATSAAEFGRQGIEELTSNPYPDFIKRDYYAKFGEDGIVMYIIYDIETGKEEAALRDIKERMFKFSNSIEGLKTILEPIMSFEEMFSLIKMGAPPQ